MHVLLFLSIKKADGFLVLTNLRLIQQYTVQHPKEIIAAEMNKKGKRNLDFSNRQI